MVGTAPTIEREIEDAQSTRDAGVGSKMEDQPSSSSGKRQMTYVSHEFQDQGKDWASSQPGQRIYYFCRQPGHVRRDCPKRQGSHDFGTTQSQLAVEEESIQFIPPHPSIQFRGAIQAPSASQFIPPHPSIQESIQIRGAIQAHSASQVGQRGQSVGRGKLQDSQAGTSS